MKEKRRQLMTELRDMQYLFDDTDMWLIKDGRRVKTWQLTRKFKPKFDRHNHA